MSKGENRPSTATRAIEDSDSLDDAIERFLTELGGWVNDCVDRYHAQPATDGHDQATFTVSWPVWFRCGGNDRGLQFMQQCRDRIRDHHIASGKWRHGYWRMQEAHHGTEHFELFLGALWRAGGDEETRRQIVDAAEHLGNWSPDVPPWYDWDRRVYRSQYFGADGVRDEPRFRVNVPDHFRCVNIALLAHDATGDSRYLDLASGYAGHWAEALLECRTLPAGLTDAGAAESFDEAGLPRFVGQAKFVAVIDRAENLLASGAIDALLTLWQRTGAADLRRAAEKLLDVLATQLDDPDAGAAADVLRTYRRVTGDARYDDAIRGAVRRLRPFAFSSLSLSSSGVRKERPTGVGKRSDQPEWREDDAPRTCNPILLACAAEIEDDVALATRALDIGRTMFSLARELFPDGRDHGCAAQTVSAIARGHGRENNAGVVSAVLEPLLAGAPRRRLPTTNA